MYKQWVWRLCVRLNAYVSLHQVISVRHLAEHVLILQSQRLRCQGINHDCGVEVVAGSMSQCSSLLDFTLAGDLVTQQVVGVQIETNSAFLRSAHPESSHSRARLFLYCGINCRS